MAKDKQIKVNLEQSHLDVIDYIIGKGIAGSTRAEVVRFAMVKYLEGEVEKDKLLGEMLAKNAWIAVERKKKEREEKKRKKEEEKKAEKNANT